MNKESPFVPDIIIPGFPKSGTSSLYKYLTEHPKISGGNGKEPHIYTYESRYKNRFNSASERSYLNNFNGIEEDLLKLEASTTYMISLNAAERIYADNPDCKLIIIARDPIERVLSHYNWLRSLGIEKQSFTKAISDWENVEFKAETNFAGNYKYYIEFSKYGEQIERYLKEFNRSQILFISLEELKINRDKTLDRIFNFLNLSSINNRSTEIVNKTKRKSKVYTTPNFLKRFTKFIPFRVRSKIRKLYLPNLFSKVVTPHVLSDLEETMLYDALKFDLEKLKSLGYKSSYWQTVNRIESKVY